MQNGNGKDNHDRGGFISKALRVAAYPFAGFVGWWVTKNQIRHYTFQKLTRTGGIDDIRQEFDTKIKDLTAEGVSNIQQGNVEYSLRRVTRPVEKQYEAAIYERMEKLHVHTIGRQSEYIYKPQFHKALLEGFTAASIALGGILILANSKAIAQAFADDEAQKDPQAPQRS